MFGPRLSKFRIKRFEKEIEPQEILLDSLAQKKEREFGISEKKLEIPLSQKILRGFWFGFLILVLLLFAKTAQLQILEHETFIQRSEENRFAIRLIQAQRGVIYDQDLNQLVFNKPEFDFVCDGQVVSENLNHQDLIFYEVKINEYEGCVIENNTAREYLGGSVFSQVIGYQRKTGGKTGLEDYYDDILKAQPGEVQVSRDVYGNPLAKEIISQPAPGQSLVLYLDAGLQEKVSQALEKTVQSVGAKGGAAVALDPKTGGVLALASLPSFNNNLFSQGITQEEWNALEKDPRTPLFNRAISGVGYPSGSTIKPLIGLAALEEGVLSPETRIDSPLEICVQNPWYPDRKDCYADWKYHGLSDLKRALAESVNTFFYQIGGGYENLKGLGATKIKEWLQIFNWGSKTGIDLPREGAGILPDLANDWRLGDTYHLSIGQGPFAITPLQVATAYVALANGGTVFQPQVVKKIINSDKNTVQEIAPKIIKVIPAEADNTAVVREGMRQGVTSPQGSSYMLNFLPVSAAAKTGTAQTGKEEVYHNWVAAFAPYDDPEIVLVILIENVTGVQAAALPVAQEVLNWYFNPK